MLYDQYLMRFICFLITSMLLLGSSLLAAPLDFDADGISDLLGFENQNDGSPNELVHSILLSSSSEISRSEYGSSADVAVPADYDGDGQADIAVAHLSESIVVWKIKSSSQNGEINEVTFGQAGDYAIGGCDFDADGKADPAIYRGSSLHYLKSSDQSENSIDLGVADLEYFYCADLNADQASDLIAAKAQITVSAKRAKRKQTKSITRYVLFSWDNSGNKLLEKQIGQKFSGLLALDSNQDGSLEAGFHRKISSKQSKISLFSGDTQTDFILPSFSVLASGIFALDQGNAQTFIVDTKVSGVFLKYPSLSDLNAQSVSIPGADSLLDQSNFGLLGSLASENCTASYKAPDGNEGFLWKPVSDSTGTAVLLFPASFRFKSARIEKKGQLLETLYYRNIGNGNRQHWGSRKKANTFPSGLTIVGVKGKERHCWPVSTPTKRID